MNDGNGKQMHLLDPGMGTDPHKLTRREDPATSHAAGQRVNTTKLEQVVLDAIRGFGVRGCISDDVLRALPTLRYNSVTPRYAALIEKGYVVRTWATRKGESTNAQHVMVAAEWHTQWVSRNPNPEANHGTSGAN
jgi:hypothetical protein